MGQKAKVIQADVAATNGVVHVINGVLTPPSTLGAAEKNIVELAAGIPDLSTLVTALSGTGPFTVFAPTNEAFAALPAATLASLLKPANIKELDAILEYHVIAGAAVRAEDLKASQDVKTLEGQKLHITKAAGSVTVQKVKVIQADLAATNGVVHVIDGVLTPPMPSVQFAFAPGRLSASKRTLGSAGKNIVQLAEGIPDLSTLVTALKAGKLVTALQGDGPFTVFAPTNEAFAALPAATLASLLKPANIEQLDAILKYHVISGAAIFADKLLRSTDVKTLQGQTLSITKVNGTLTVQKAKVIKADVAATNGVVHVIDGVLSPPKNIVQLAASMPDLSTLVTALKAGKLITFLSQGSSFTVFAPTNEAFA